MSGKSIISNSYLEDIGDAIRYKKGTEETFYPYQMGDAIRSIEGIVPSGTMSIDENGVYDVTEKASVDVNVVPDLRPLSVSENGEYQPGRFDGYSDVTVDVQPELTSLSVTENGLYLPDVGVDGFDRVSVDVPPTIPDLVPLDVTANGHYLPTGHDGFSEVNVNVPFVGTLVKTVTLTEDINQYPNAWRQYLELDKGIYIAVFEGNTYATASQRVDMLILGQGKNDSNSAGITVRNDWKNAVAGASISGGASAGTVIKVYQMPSGINA